MLTYCSVCICMNVVFELVSPQSFLHEQLAWSAVHLLIHTFRLKIMRQSLSPGRVVRQWKQ